MPDPQHMQRVALDEVTHLIPPDDEPTHLTGCELFEAQADARPLGQASHRRDDRLHGLRGGRWVRIGEEGVQPREVR